MSDGRRRRYRRGRDEKEKKQLQAPVIVLAKRENNEHAQTSVDTKPKILLKSKTEKDNEPTNSNYVTNEGAVKTIIVNRSEQAPSPILSATASPNITREAPQSTAGNVEAVTQTMSNMQILEPVAKMARFTTIVSSTGYVNTNLKKLLMKQNTEFLVVGVVGTQGVGKSTIMNLLASEDTNINCYKNLFLKDEGMFRTRSRSNKCSARANTESIHIFVNSDRVIFLDTPPVETNPYKKDMTSSELDDLHLIIGLYSVCHLLIVVEDEYLNLNFMRLLRFAELMKQPTQEDKHIISNYLPQLLFVRNRVTSTDFNAAQIEEYNLLKAACFDDSELNIYLGKTATTQATSVHSPQHNLSSTEQLHIKQKRTRNNEIEKPVVNTCFIPNVEAWDEYSQIALQEAIKKLRRLVFMTPRNQMYNGTQEVFTEHVWFDMLTQIWQDTQYFFLNTYENMHRKVYEVALVKGNAGGFSGGGPTGNSNNGNHHSSYGKDRDNDWK